MAKRNRCKHCGKVISKYAGSECKKCYEARMQKIYAENIKIVKSGICPQCGEKIKANLSITGWYQCEQLGAETHRKDPSKPSCEYQCFVC